MRDSRRADKFNRTKKHFKSGKHKPKTKKDSVVKVAKTNNNNNNSKKGTDRRALKRIAAETLEIIEIGQYEIEDQLYNIDKIKPGITYSPDELPLSVSLNNTPTNNITNSSLNTNNNTSLNTNNEEALFEVLNSTTLNAAYNYIVVKNEKNVGILNFASAKNPGGGFIKGSNAQEESIARSSNLYASIKNSSMYDYNSKDNNKCLYSHHMIYSPDVTVFRNDSNDLIPPYKVNVLTVPAVNSKQALAKGVHQDMINKTMTQRIDNLLSVASHHGIDYLVLGAWGCGVFGGDFNMVGQKFVDIIRTKYNFKKVIFALLSNKDIEIINDIINQ